VRDVEITISSDFTLPLTIKQELLPAKTTVNFNPAICFSPSFFVTISEAVSANIAIEVKADGRVIGTSNLSVTLRGYNEFFGTAFQTELLAAYVSDKSPIATKILKGASSVLENWKMKFKLEGGYKTLDNNEVRFATAAIMASVQDLAISRDQEVSLETPVVFTEAAQILSGKKATLAEMAILVSSAIRAAGFNPVLVQADGEFFVAVWLADRCFNEPIVDDIGQLVRRVGAGVNEMEIFNVASLFDGESVNLEASAKDAMRKLSQPKKIDFILDVKRARVGGVKPIPERIKTKQGWQVVAEESFDITKAPTAIKTYDNINLKVEGSREKQWERRLLDLSQKNALLNFKESGAIHLLVTDLTELDEMISSGEGYSIADAPVELDKIVSDVESFETKVNVNPLPELVSIEFKNKRIHAFYPAKKLEPAIMNLYRKERTFVEETGANSLFLASGFLKWYARDDKTPKYAPILLYPVSITREGVARGFKITLREEDVSINMTLLEFLKQEFNLDLRGLTNLSEGKIDINYVFGLIRNEIMALNGWNIVNDVYLCSVTFSRYMMWHDVRYKIEDIRNNPVVSSIINGISFKGVALSKNANPDSAYTSDKVFLPINADSSQFAAVVDSGKESFVLHGPPGTGKSQTITNMIACALARGKRVLFVAEKMAALSVVKNRLTEIGIADFCLELHSNKANKTEIAERIGETLKLADDGQGDAFAKKAEELAALAQELADVNDAVHKERRLGVSVYDGIVRYLEYQDAPDILEIDNTFFERLNAASFKGYEDTLLEMAACATEIGDVRRTPFRNIELLEFSGKWKRRSEGMLGLYLEQLPYTRRITDICLSEIGTRVRKLSKSKLNSLYEFAKLLIKSGPEIKELMSVTGTPAQEKLLNDYKNAVERYTQVVERYDQDFNGVPEKINYELLQIELEDETGKRRNCCAATLKKLEQFQVHTLLKEKKDYYLRLLLLRRSCKQTVDEKAQELIKAVPQIKDIPLERILKSEEALEHLAELAETIYTDFDRKAFEAVIEEVTVSEAYDSLLLFMNSYKMLLSTEHSFIKQFCYTGGLENLEEDYFEFMIKKLSAIKESLYLMPSWVRFNHLAKRCHDEGLSFAVKALTEGRLRSDDLVRSFRKKVYKNFVETEIALDDRLNEFSAAVTEESIDRFRRFNDEFQDITRREIRARLIGGLSKDTDDFALERLMLARAVKSKMKGLTLRQLFKDIPEIVKIAAPCMLMSPISVAQYLEINDDKFDIVVFDEASQVPTAEAVGAMARGKTVVIVGDANQLPPTSFFVSDYVDEDNLEDEDLESVLDEAIAVGLPEHHLLWHYRSKHESLISFSNAMYYENKLLTFPSPNELSSKVMFHYVEGVYDRGGAKTNSEEAEALINAVISKLSDPLDKSSIGIVTFSSAQRSLIEDRLTAAISKHKLEGRAMSGDEPLFVKNLENVQGDERDIIYFSVGYGPDKYCRLSLNFGPLNKQGGFRRLNVAVTRAKSEMHMFSSITSDMIDLAKTTSKGVLGLKAFLEFADKGKTMLALDASEVREDKNTVGMYIAEELKKEGIRCECNVGDSGFKIDVGVIDPIDENKYLLGILCDSLQAGEVKSVRDKYVLEVKTLKLLGWNLYRMWTVNFLQNPKREIKRVKAYIERLAAVQSGKFKSLPENAASKFKREYKAVPIKAIVKGGIDFVLNVKNEAAMKQKAESIIALEQPIAESVLQRKLFTIYGINRTNTKAVAKINELLEDFSSIKTVFEDTVFYTAPEVVTYDYYRPKNDGTGKRAIGEIHPSEFIAAARCIVERYVSVPRADLVAETAKIMGFTKPTGDSAEYINYCIDEGVKKGMFLVALDNKITF
jgi:KaiC/GvpD/RAD55 family RecA-like ATPase